MVVTRFLVCVKTADLLLVDLQSRPELEAHLVAVPVLDRFAGLAPGGWRGAALAAQDLGSVLGMLDLLAMAPGARMVGDDGGAVEQAD